SRETDEIEILLPPRISHAIDRHVDRLRFRIDLAKVPADVRRILGRARGRREKCDALVVAREGADEHLVDLARLAERELAAADQNESRQRNGDVKPER